MGAADVTQHADPSGRQQLWAKCGRCNNWGTVGDMQIGHIEAWADYVEDKAPADTAEASQAYNDLANLRIEHAGCNAGAGADVDSGDDGDDSYEAGSELSDNDEPLNADQRAEFDAALTVIRGGMLMRGPAMGAGAGGTGDGGFGAPVPRVLTNAERDALEGP